MNTKNKKKLPSITISAKEQTAVLEDLAKRSAKKTEVGRAAKNGDELTVDFKGVNKSGESVAGASGTDYALELGSKSFIPGFEEGLLGVKKGDKKTLKLSFPKDYHVKELADTAITFEVEVKTVMEQMLRKIDDSFAATLGPFTNC